jgi:hypothetical protein
MAGSREPAGQGSGVEEPPPDPHSQAPLPLLRFHLAGFPRVAVLTVGIALLYILLLWIGRDVPVAVAPAQRIPARGTLIVETTSAPVPVPVRLAPRPVEEEAPVPPPAAAAPAAGGDKDKHPAPVAAAAPSAPAPAAPAAPASPAAGGRPSVFNVAPANTACVVYLIDVSGSMLNPLDPKDGPQGRTRFDAAADEVRRSIRFLPPETEFDIVLFGDRAVAMAPAPVAASAEAKRAATAFLAHLPDVEGGTNFVAGIGAALKMAPGSIFLLTDGGANEPAWQLLRKISLLQATAPAPSRLYAFGMTPVLEDDGDALLQKLCHMTGGAFQPMTEWNRPAPNPAPAPNP